MSKPLWSPPPTHSQSTRMAAFLDYACQEWAPQIDSYAGLHRWSVEHPERFWPAVWAFCGIVHSRPWDTVLEGRERMPGARWFRGAQLNFAENLLRHRDRQPALIFDNERSQRRSLSYAQLYSAVARLAASLRRAGLQPGDRVAALTPNCPETVIAMLASASVGAIWSSCSPDFGARGVLDRFAQIEPKVLFAADGYFYKNQAIDCLETLRSIVPQLPSLEQVVVFPYVSEEPVLDGIAGASTWERFQGEESVPQIVFEQLPFDHPLYILFSSGTTGAPKCIVHSAGGTLIQHLKEHALHTDIGRDDRVFYYTTCGWMMWNWLVSALASGATVVLYDGSPMFPRAEAMFDLAEREALTVFGTSARYLAAAEKAGVRPRQSHDLRPLRCILSTGSPLLPESFDYVYEKVKADVQLSSISGGTDIVSCFALGNPALPVYRGELQCRGLGMDVHVYDETGQAVRQRKGELVCRTPFPSMPLGFWGDPDGARYHRAYFARFAGVWAQGDYAELTEHDGLVIYGRSDAVLNPGGVRIGTAEIYRQAESLDEVLESLAIGQRWEGDVRVVLFVVLRAPLVLDETLAERIRGVIRRNATPRHVPAKIVQVQDLPRTRSGKLAELAVRAVVHGEPVENVGALSNPDCLQQFRDLLPLGGD